MSATLNLMYKHADTASCPSPNESTIFKLTDKPNIHYAHRTQSFTVPSVTSQRTTEIGALIAAGWINSARDA